MKSGGGNSNYAVILDLSHAGHVLPCMRIANFTIKMASLTQSPKREAQNLVCRNQLSKIFAVLLSHIAL